MKKSMVSTFFVVLFATLTVFAQNAGSIQDQQACEYARRNNSAEIWQNYLRRFPQGMCAFEAESEIQKLANKNPNRSKQLQWSNRAPHRMEWASAVYYCQNLNEKGYSDWHLPTINELRTIVTNCSNCQTGGSCNITDSCTAQECFSDDNCHCAGGSNYSMLGDSDGTILWSSSERSNGKGKVWIVAFERGRIFIYRHGKTNAFDVRCVR